MMARPIPSSPLKFVPQHLIDPLSSTANVTFTITEVNDAPTGVDDSLSSSAEDTVRTISFASLLSNDLKGPANESNQTLTIINVGNAVGGYRTPYVDVPVATYHMHHDGTAPNCRQFGWEERFDWPTLQRLYGTYAAYAAKVDAAVASAVKDRRLTASMAARVKDDLLNVVPAPTRQTPPRTAGAGSPSR